MTGHVAHGAHAGLVLIITCPACGLDAGTLDPHDARPLAAVLDALTTAHTCPPPGSLGP